MFGVRTGVVTAGSRNSGNHILGSERGVIVVGGQNGVIIAQGQNGSDDCWGSAWGDDCWGQHWVMTAGVRMGVNGFGVSLTPIDEHLV